VAWDEFFDRLRDEELGQVCARTMRELRDRSLIRSWNNPVADYAERLAAEEFGLELTPPVTRGYHRRPKSKKREAAGLLHFSQVRRSV
jgi:hypothetical protein